MRSKPSRALTQALPKNAARNIRLTKVDGKYRIDLTGPMVEWAQRQAKDWKCSAAEAINALLRNILKKRNSEAQKQGLSSTVIAIAAHDCRCSKIQFLRLAF